MVAEILLHNHAVAHMIRDNKIHHLEGYLQNPEHKATGMQSMETAVNALMYSGLITPEEAAFTISSLEVDRAR